MSKRIRINNKTREMLTKIGGRNMSLDQALEIVFRKGTRIGPEYYEDARLYAPKTTAISDESKQKLDAMKNEYEKRFGLRTTYTKFVNMLLQTLIEPQSRKSVTVNVKGYKSKPTEYRGRIRKIAEHLARLRPEIVFVQEFIAGEDQAYAKEFSAILGGYIVIMPGDYDPEEHFGFCICVAFVRPDIYEDVTIAKLPGADDPNIRLRYNYFTIKDATYLNVWIPQIPASGPEAGAREALGKKMWNGIIATARANATARHEFYLVGDMNSYTRNGEGAYETELAELQGMIRDTKDVKTAGKPTCTANELDRVFANRAATERQNVVTTMLAPSFIRLALTDHEALIINKYN